MLSTDLEYKSCALKIYSGNLNKIDDNNDSEDSKGKLLHKEDKCFVCDISMMDMYDHFGETMNNNSLNYRNGEMNEDHGILVCNEVEIDQHDEEQTVSELVKARAANNDQLAETTANNQMRIALGILLRLLLPFAKGVLRSIKCIRDVRFLRILNGITLSRHALCNLIAFAANTLSLNLSSVQVPHRIEPILKLMHIRKSSHGMESLSDTSTNNECVSATCRPASTFSPLIGIPKNGISTNIGKRIIPEKPPEKCCSLQLLAEPSPGEPIRADIIFIHGLHGSLANTWKQGLWENDRRPVEFQRPPKPPVRPPKRARHSRSTCIRPPHKQKRPRFAHLDDLHRQSFDHETQDELFDNNKNEFTYLCGEPLDIKVCDGIEYRFPKFYIRMNDDGHLISTEIKTIINSDNSKTRSRDDGEKKDAKDTKPKTKLKITPNDPDYSKCWPRDWLPLDCPGLRVIAVNYTTDQYLFRPLWKKKEPRTNLIQRAREMAELLIEQKVGHGHPIVWVGHSKGGLFVKQIIVDAWESGRPTMTPLWRSARGCFFYSVPHRGSHLASIKAPLLTRSIELLDIEKNSKYLLDLHRRFAGLYHSGHLKVEVFSFVETALTLMSVLYLRIVGVDSADPGIGDVCGIRLDHREICKPRSRDCILYKELVKMIRKVS